MSPKSHSMNRHGHGWVRLRVEAVHFSRAVMASYLTWSISFLISIYIREGKPLKRYFNELGVNHVHQNAFLSNYRAL